MGKKEKKGLLEICVLAAKATMCIVILFLALFFIDYGIVQKAEFWDDEPMQFIESWTVIDKEGNETVTGREYTVDKVENERDYKIFSTLPEGIRDNEYLFFYIRKDIEVYINGELRMDFEEDKDVVIPGGTVKQFYIMIPLKPSDSGAKIELVRSGRVPDGQLVAGSFVSTRFGAFCYMMKTWGFSFVLASIMLVFAIVVFIVSIVLRILYKLKINMMYGALGIMVLGLWLITDSFLFQFVFGINYVNGIINYLLCLMIPFAPTIYLNAVQGGRYRKSMSLLLILSVITALVLPTLHFTGVAAFDLLAIRLTGNFVLVFMSIEAIVVLIVDAIKGNIASYRYTFVGFFGFLVCCIIELVALIVDATIKDAFPIVIGLGFLLVFIVIQQVNDLRLINVEKQHAMDISEAKTRFLASMSHEIRTPINAILGMNEMILRENSDQVIGEYSKSIKTSGKMLLMLVNDVLDFSKIEAGKLEINESRFLMSDVLYDVISLVKERADEKSLALETEITDKVPNELISDEFRIRQILVNLINNAVKYTEKGTVTLIVGGSYSEDGYELMLTVKDTGKGIREEDQPHLFEAFSRADVKSNVNIEGTGLGLAIVKSIVDSMNGTIGVESEYGVGSEFWVKLPVLYENMKPLDRDFMNQRPDFEAEVDECSFTAPDARILAVDDNQSNLTIVKLFLKRTGIVPDLCSSGTRALELCREKEYDLILLDHMMPQPDGIETLHNIRSDAKSLNKDTKAVVLTANAVAGSRQMYMKEGFADYLTKPLDSKVLEQTVKSMLPADKVMEVCEEEEVLEFAAAGESVKGSGSSGTAVLKDRLTAIEGLDYETAMRHCGGSEDMLEEILNDIVSESVERCKRMKQSLADEDIDSYRIDSHSIKSNMATLGLAELSKRAKQHEFAARDKDLTFIKGDAEAFISAYAEVCRKLKG